jgi:uncharacterized protein (TIGR00251 family)
LTIEDLRRKLQTEKRLILELKAIPKSSSNEIVEVTEDGTLRMKVTVAPEKGKANRAICTLLADVFAVPKSRVAIVLGGNSSHKRAVISLEA